MESINPSSDISVGLQTAWLLATLGSKPSIRSKLIKKDILNILIPKLCKELSASKENQHHNYNNEYENNIRYVSNIMYGISILYQTKINYFITDLATIENRLRLNNHNILNKGNLIINNNHVIKNFKKRGRYLDDDPCFSIQLGLLPPIIEELENNDESDSNKRRKLNIEQRDMEIFPISQEQSQGVANPLGSAISNVINDDKDVLNDMIDRLADVSTQFDHIIADDFQFNEDGEILDIGEKNMNKNKHREEAQLETSNSGMESLMDIVFIENNENEEIVQRHEGNEQEGGISNDLNFHTNETTIASELPQNKSIPRRRLIIDNQSKLTSEFIVSSTLNYESKMASLMDHKEVLPHNLDEIYRAAIIEGGAYLKYVNRIILPWTNDGSSTTDHSSFTRTLSVLQRTEEAVTGEEPTEEGRDTVRGRGFNLHEELPIDIIDDHQVQQNELPEETQRIFDLEFDYDEDPPLIELSTKSRSLTDSSIDLHTQEGDVLDKKLRKFYRYLRDRSGDLGTLISGSYSILKPSQNLTTHTEVSFGDFYKTNFEQLVPRDSKIEDELPINRRIAANSFSSILTLATKNLIGIEIETEEMEINNLHKGDQINIILPL